MAGVVDPMFNIDVQPLKNRRDIIVDTSTFFMVIAGTAVLGFVALLFMNEPSGTITEVKEDGSVELISVS